jgi:hypothetical protein
MSNDTRRVVLVQRWMEEALVKVGGEDTKIEMTTMIIIIMSRQLKNKTG